jgi:hypothetical protein
MIAFLILLIFEVVRNWTLIVYLERSPNHDLGTLFRVAYCLAFALWVYQLNFIHTGLYLISCGLAFWFPFDVLLNLTRGRAWNYLGFNAKLDVETKGVKHLWLYKAVLMVVGLIGIYLTQKL